VSTPSTIYLGGQFSSVGPATGGCLFVDGAGASLPGFPRVAGQVFCTAPDGVGGWYIGGYFTTGGGLPGSNLARILANGSVGAWNPGTDADVYALAVSGTTVYVGGLFDTAGGQPRQNLAALDATSGLATAWNPGANLEVFALATNGTTVYA